MAEIVDQEQEVLSQQALSIVQRASLVKITDQQSYNSACDLLQKEIVPFRKRWGEFWAPLKASAWTAYKKIQDRFKEYDEPAEMAERAIKTEIAKWNAEQERIFQEKQREAQREAETQAEEERLRAAIVAEEAGASEQEVQAIVETPIAVVAPLVEATYKKASGISIRSNWQAKVTDMKALCRAVGAGKVPVDYVQPNMSALNARARADRSTLDIPGVVAFDNPTVAGRGR
jgi:vacuolar-type H+-ATPase subunit E/Vma4